MYKTYSSIEAQDAAWALLGTSNTITWANLWAFIMGKVAS